MKKWIPAITIAILFLNGCWTVSETAPPPIKLGQKFKMNLRLEGFEYFSLQRAGSYVESSSASAYNYRTNAFATGNAVTSGNTYEYRQDQDFSDEITDVFETLGFNVRSEKPRLVLKGRVGSGWFDWSDPMLYLRDGFAVLLSFPTFMAVGSYERENDARILVYSIDGQRLADYSSTRKCYVFSLAVPFANFGNPKAYRTYGDYQAACFALSDCINEFTEDLRKGRFDAAISEANTQYAKNSQENRGNKE